MVGLGNPGEKYLGTRHNLGFMALDEIAQKKLGSKYSWEMDKKFKAEILKFPDDLWLVKPQSYMNNSGAAVSSLVNYFRIPPEELIVIYDELDLPIGKIKIRLGGAAAGHHGVESIINYLNNDKFVRIRLGIGNLRSLSGERGRQHFSADKFVLEPFNSKDRTVVKKMLKQTVEALDLLLEEGLEKAQSQYN